MNSISYEVCLNKRKGTIMVLRNIVKIDETKCNGCGICIPSCAEGAIQIIDDKAKLVKEIYCDGLGACLGKCPQNAIAIIQREAEKFDEKAAEEHMKIIQKRPTIVQSQNTSYPSLKTLRFKSETGHSIDALQKADSRLSTWPVQLKLIPPNAPFIQKSDLLIAADCVPFAYADFHEDLLKDKVLVVGCPKLDDINLYRNKLTAIFRDSNIQNITVVNMEVPCCFGLHRLVQEALELSGKKIPVKQETISIKGEKIA